MNLLTVIYAEDFDIDQFINKLKTISLIEIPNDVENVIQLNCQLYKSYPLCPIKSVPHDRIKTSQVKNKKYKTLTFVIKTAISHMPIIFA
ncbi:unnamed protein product [Cunninghamella echinulata]